LLKKSWTEQEMELLNFFPSKKKEGMILVIRRLHARYEKPGRFGQSFRPGKAQGGIRDGE